MELDLDSISGGVIGWNNEEKAQITTLKNQKTSVNVGPGGYNNGTISMS